MSRRDRSKPSWKENAREPFSSAPIEVFCTGRDGDHHDPIDVGLLHASVDDWSYDESWQPIAERIVLQGTEMKAGRRIFHGYECPQCGLKLSLKPASAEALWLKLQGRVARVELKALCVLE